MLQNQTVVLRRINNAVMSGIFIVGAVVILAYSAFAPSAEVSLSAAGQVAPQDITAPYSLTYESQVLTDLARKAAADGVQRVYDPPNPGVLRDQIRIARQLLDYFTNIRADLYAAVDQRAADLRANTIITLSDEEYLKILGLDEAGWQIVDAQTMSMLERVMRNEIREDTLWSVINNLPNLVSITVSDEQATLIIAVVKGLIRPNTFYNDERTKSAKNAAAEAVKPVTRSFIQGQIVVRAGAVVSDADMEALRQLGLLRPTDERWRAVASAVLAVALLYGLMITYLHRFHPDLLRDQPRMALIGGLLLVFLAGSRMFGGEGGTLSYLFPASAFPLILVAFVDSQVAGALTAGLAALVGLATGNSLQFAAIVAAGGAAGILVMRDRDHLSGYFTAGLTIAVVNVAITILFGLTRSGADAAQIVGAIPASLLNGGLAAGLGLVGLFLVSRIFNLPSSVRLLELSQPNQPLLQRLLREAPGTYQHSLQVANLAELAAEQIGANAALVRVGALYHDIGKLTAPPFFVENQAEGVNPHERLRPEDSARIIINHVIEGAKMARKNHLPAVIVDYILQHHGTTRVLYFYNKAMEAAGGDEAQVNDVPFTYPGPCPQTREAAIMMLADASETIVRSRRTRDKQEIADIIEDLIQLRLTCGQLDESGLTIKELKVIKEVFVNTLQGVFHPRIIYPAPPKTHTQEMTVIPTDLPVKENT